MRNVSNGKEKRKVKSRNDAWDIHVHFVSVTYAVLPWPASIHPKSCEDSCMTPIQLLVVEPHVTDRMVPVTYRNSVQAEMRM